MSPVPVSSPSPWRRLLFGLLALGLLALVVHTVFGEHGYLALRQQQRTLEELQKEIRRLEQENRRLAEEIEALKKDPGAIERVAREQLKMARPGEKVITLPPKPDSQTNSSEAKKP